MKLPEYIRSQTGRRMIPIVLLGFSLLLLPGFQKKSSPAPETEWNPANATIKKYEPVLAVRASGCITCHAEVYSSFITDFGSGDSYFFGNPSCGSKVGPFNGSIYGDFIAESGKTGWLTARFHKDVIVPQASIDFNLRDAAGNGLKDQPAYQDAFNAATLSKYIETLEKQKPQPASVIEAKNLYIGAPDATTLASRFGIKPGESTDLKYVTSHPNASPDISGIGQGENGKYLTNPSEIVCDGDLFVRGMLFLNKPIIRTNTGCRLYATGPIFLQGPITYIDSNLDHANLQLVSSEAVFLGTGQKKCRSEGDPLDSRLLKTPALTSLFTRSADNRGIKPEAFMQSLYDKASLVPLEDSSCQDSALSLSRLLINAPIVHSRYSGKFRGVLIAEFALFWQAKSSYEFDPVFRDVPILPLLKESDYLHVDPIR